MTIRERYQQRVSGPPDIEDDILRRWLRDVADALNTLPPFSTFSYETPESNVSAIQGTLGVNLADSSHTKLWVKQSGDGTTGWASLTTA
jgi:hypothetical protein